MIDQLKKVKALNLEMAVGPSKKVQDFDPESLDAGVEHSQKVTESIQTTRAKSSITEETGRLRDRSEINFTVIEEKNGSDRVDFSEESILPYL